MPRTRRSLDCRFCPGRHECTILKTLSDEGFDLLNGHRLTREFGRHEQIYSAGDQPRGIWIVCQGKVKTWRTGSDGKVMITSVVAPGQMVGVADYLAWVPYADNAEALTSVTAALVDADVLQKLLATEAAFSQALMAQLAIALRRSQDQAMQLAYGSARDRVLQVLHEFPDDAPKCAPGSSYPVLMVRRQEIAERAGLTVETTVRVLKELERDGRVRVQGRRIELRDCLRPVAA